MIEFEQLKGLKKVDNEMYDCEYIATNKDWLKELQEYEIIGIKTLLKDIDYLIDNQNSFFLWFNNQGQIVFEW